MSRRRGGVKKWLNEPAEERLARFEAERAEGATRTEAEHRTKGRRSFLTGAAGAAAGFAGWRFLQGRPDDGNVPDLLRDGYEFNEALWKKIGSQSKLVSTYDLGEATSLRVNGRRGIREELDLANWELRVEDLNGDLLESFDVAGMRAVVDGLPRVDHVIEHKCIEGWSARPRWGGVTFDSFAARYAADVPDNYKYVSMTTPGNGYYVGVDRPTMLNAQTLLVTDLGGEPLTDAHGAPLRMATPHKYGIKSLKRIGTIRFTNERPADFWAERGYTYWAGF